MGYIKRHAYTITVTFIIAALLTAAYAAGWLLTRDKAQPQVELAAAVMQYPEDGCKFVQTLTFTACAHTTTVSSELPDELSKHPLSQLGDEYPRWRFTELSPKFVAVTRKAEGYCPEHVLLVSEDERLTLYRMSADGGGYRPIRYYNDRVKYSARQLLEVGKVFGTEGEARAFIFKNRA